MKSTLVGDQSTIDASLTGLLLRIALAHARADTALTVGTLAASLESTAQFLRAAGACSRLLSGVPASPLDDPEHVARWVERQTLEIVLDALGDEQRRIDHARVGSIYEAVLSLRVRRLVDAAVALRTNGAYVSARKVLAQPAKLRSKWVQRTFALPKSAVERLAPALSRASDEEEMLRALAPLAERNGAAGELVVDAGVARRSSGSHYTPETLAAKVLARALGPLLEGASSSQLLSLTVCDPAMGSGAFLEETARLLSDALLAAWRREGAKELDRLDAGQEALRLVVTRCLRGVDRDAVATDLARARLARLATGENGETPDLSAHFRVGDALVGRIRKSVPGESLSFDYALGHNTDGVSGTPAFDWFREFPDVFAAEPAGFDACIGNPPWIAYVGRAAQPLEAELARYYEATNPAFRNYRTLHGLFVRRAAELVRVGGRLGLVLPTSVADLSGYGPTRDAHDALCDVDRELYDFGDGAFAGVFQPCMALTSTRRAPGTPVPGSTRSSIWPLGRSDLDAVATRLLERLDALPKLPGELFGERGFQTTGDDLAHLRKLDAAAIPFVVPIREGADISEFRVEAPRTFLDPTDLRGRLRDAADFRAVGVLIRQTARYPIASLSDGEAFRNSILAGFPRDGWTSPALAAYLNSTIVRFFHFTRHRDARQGMPQLKIGHLRALPAVEARFLDGLDAMGATLARANAGIGAEARAELDAHVSQALALDDAERSVVRKWALANPLPKPRRVAAPRTEPDPLSANKGGP